MRLRLKENLVLGEKRVKRGFLIFPKIIKDELRWLQYAEWKQEVIYRSIIHDYTYCGQELKWVNVEWL
jgi:hypothetical protein